MSYFVQLTETNTTLNLEQITSVEWNYVSEDLEGTNYTTTVNLASGTGYYLTSNDARTLWRAMQRYNQFVQSNSYQSVRNHGGGVVLDREDATMQPQNPNQGRKRPTNLE
ncbi:MAG TPA: hypothetical protein VH186_03945 [Chloroflexia bacterium]|nr:hypothetical protein [Chloroflexia bacterium]